MRGSAFSKVQLKKGGQWGSKHVYHIRLLDEIQSVECDLIEMRYSSLELKFERVILLIVV